MIKDSLKEQVVSVVIPSYERHEEVVRAVRSALNQTLPPLEVIVSNDGPDPEKARLLEAMDDGRVRFFEAPRRGNASATRNFGILQAKGDWVALLDDDDWWLPKKLEDQFTFLKERGSCAAIISGKERVYTGKGSSWIRPRFRPDGLGDASEIVLRSKGGFNTSTILAPRDAFIEFPFNEDINKLEDVEWVLVAGQKYDYGVCPTVTCERLQDSGPGLSQPGGYELVLDWYVRNRPLLKQDAVGYVLSDLVARRAGYEFRYDALLFLLCELKRERALGFGNVVRLLGHFIVPQQIRPFLKKILNKRSLRA